MFADVLVEVIRDVIGLEGPILGYLHDPPPNEPVPVIAPDITLAANFPWWLSV